VPKMKTRKAVAARFRVTATGKLKASQPGKRHLLTHKTAKRKRQLRRPNSYVFVTKCFFSINHNFG
jgi:large subunit ribosomal protein L35